MKRLADSIVILAALIAAFIIVSACKTVDGKKQTDCAAVQSIARTTASLGGTLTLNSKPELRGDFEKARSLIGKARAGVTTIAALREATAALGPKAGGVVNAALDFVNRSVCLGDALNGLAEGLDAALGEKSVVPAGSSDEYSRAVAALRKRGVL